MNCEFNNNNNNNNYIDDVDMIIIINNVIKTNKNVIFANIYNGWNLGDNIFNIIFLNKLSSYFEANNIHILYFLKPEYIFQVSEFVKHKNIHLLNYTNQYINNALHLWIGNKEFNLNFYTHVREFNLPYNVFLTNFYNMICCKYIHPSLNIHDIVYEDNDLCDRYEKLLDKYKDVDVLIVNSLPLSGQFDYIESDWENIIDIFSKKYKTVITKRINKCTNSICTLDDNLTIKDIGALSIKVNIIIAVNTGVSIPLLNTYTLNHIIQYYNLDKFSYYTYPKFSNYKSLKEIDVDCLIKILENSNRHKT